MATTVNFQDPTTRAYLLQQKFPDRKNIGDKISTLLDLQSNSPNTLCNIRCGNHQLNSGTDFLVKFVMMPSPIDSYFAIELHLSPAVDNANQTDRDKSHRLRMTAVFPTYVDENPDSKYPNRIRYNYTSNMNNTAPNGPLDFSSALHAVTYKPGDSSSVSTKLLFPKPEPKKQFRFTWKSKGCARLGFNLNLATAPQTIKDAVSAFKKVINEVTTNGGTLELISQGEFTIPLVYWPWFAAIPAPVPHSFFPWLNILTSTNPQAIMVVRPQANFELMRDYITTTLAVRTGKKWQDGGPVSTLPKPLNIGQIRARVRFHSAREYIVHVLGCYLYEAQFSIKSMAKEINGQHQADVIPDPINPKRYMVLLNIAQPGKAVQTADISTQGLPDEGELVAINVNYNGIAQQWNGTVVRIPNPFRKYGRNVAIVAIASPVTPINGRITEASVVQIEAHFGHHGSAITPTQERIVGLMTDSLRTRQDTPVAGAAFLKQVLLAQDAAQSNGYTSTALPSDWRDRAQAICIRRQLNPMQQTVVIHYFTHKLTIVRGPPGTGKSTVIDTILEIEEAFKTKVWVCTASNPAIDVLVTKVCTRKGNMNPSNMLRVHPAFTENVQVTVGATGHDNRPVATINALDDKPPHRTDIDLPTAIHNFLTQHHNVTRAMSLEALIKARFNMIVHLQRNPKEMLWAKEVDDLQAFMKAFKQLHELLYEPESQESFDEIQQRLERKYQRTQSTLQRKYVQQTRVVFSTAAAASGPLLGDLAPAAVIMDEASQFLEADAVSALIHALIGNRVTRMLLVGDDLQLPPTLVAERNPLAATGQTSLFERLIKADNIPIMLNEQFRMHPDISRVVIREIYAAVGGLTDHASVNRPERGVHQFQQFVARMAVYCGNTNCPTTTSVIVSPAEDPQLSWRAQKANGSTSKFNLTTARVIYQLAYRLVTDGKFAAKDIMVLSFYKDQVQLLQSLFDDVPSFADIYVDTVDGSQGNERKVVLIDCVVLGNANGDGTGFLGTDQRRFNVAMSRAQVGRITVVHSSMIKVTNGREEQMGPWNGFLQEHRETKTIFNGARFNTPIANASLQTRIGDVFKTWSAKTNQDQTHRPGHRNRLRNTSTDATQRSNRSYNIRAFMQGTGTTEATANTYLNANNGVVHIAIDRYFHDHPLSEKAEDV
ncbi:hypothetical protein LTR17_015397 [Elasticomyces elasticus]|nr:hypothetical protein LTR17_015397 [Elasticomyces elasticus]